MLLFNVPLFFFWWIYSMSHLVTIYSCQSSSSIVSLEKHFFYDSNFSIHVKKFNLTDLNLELVFNFKCNLWFCCFGGKTCIDGQCPSWQDTNLTWGVGHFIIMSTWIRGGQKRWKGSNLVLKRPIWNFHLFFFFSLDISHTPRNFIFVIIEYFLEKTNKYVIIQKCILNH